MVDIGTLEDRTWRGKGADIADYFNYGLNEHTWKVRAPDVSVCVCACVCACVCVCVCMCLHVCQRGG